MESLGKATAKAMAKSTAKATAEARQSVKRQRNSKKREEKATKAIAEKNFDRKDSVGKQVFGCESLTSQQI